MKLVVVCIAIMLVPTGLAQLPFGPIPELQKCWAALTSTPGCVMEIYGSLLSGQVGQIGPVCCAVIAQVTEDCWPQLFPTSPSFPPLLKNFCAAPSPQAAADASKIRLPGLLPPVNAKDITECWSSLINVKGCLSEINQSLTTGQIGIIGPACCKAVTEINDKCWPKIFPFNTPFTRLLNSTCAIVIEAPLLAPHVRS